MTKTTTDLQKYTYNIKFILLLLIQYKLYRKYKALSTFWEFTLELEYSANTKGLIQHSGCT